MMSQSDFAIAVFFGALCAVVVQSAVRPKIEEWVWMAGDGSRHGIRVRGLTDAEILKRFLEAV